MSLTPRSIKLMDDANKILVLRHNALLVCFAFCTDIWTLDSSVLHVVEWSYDWIVVRIMHAGFKARKSEVQTFSNLFVFIQICT